MREPPRCPSLAPQAASAVSPHLVLRSNGAGYLDTAFLRRYMADSSHQAPGVVPFRQSIGHLHLLSSIDLLKPPLAEVLLRRPKETARWTATARARCQSSGEPPPRAQRPLTHQHSLGRQALGGADAEMAARFRPRAGLR